MAKPNTISTFRVARRLGSRARSQFRHLSELPAVGDKFSIGVETHPGMVAVDVVHGREVAALSKRYERLTQERANQAVTDLKKSRRTTLNRFMDLTLFGKIGVYSVGTEETGRELILGAELGGLSAEVIRNERWLAKVALAHEAGVDIAELGLEENQQIEPVWGTNPREGAVVATLGLIYNQPTEDAAVNFSSYLQDNFQLPGQAYFFDVTVRDATITPRK